MSTRLLGAVLLALLLVAGVAPTSALAVEEGAQEEVEPRPAFSEVGTQAARDGGFVPEEYEPPQWFQWLLYPLLIVGVVMALGILGYYLVRQPDFVRERKKSSKR